MSLHCFVCLFVFLFVCFVFIYFFPIQVTPLTAMKFAELVVKAGFPPGVINILPGKGLCKTFLFHVKIMKTGDSEIVFIFSMDNDELDSSEVDLRH